MKVHVYDFRWRDETSCELQGSVDGRFGRRPIRVGDSISVEITSLPRCGGSSENGVWKPCPKHSTGKPKCDYCRAIEGNFVFTAFDGFDQSQLQPGDIEKIQGPHVVYLALFETDVTKVGVSHAERKILRQIEQGSHQTLVWAQTPDGIAARQIESLIRRSGVADKIQSRQKKALILPEISDADGETLLRGMLERYVTALDATPHLKKFLLPNPEFFSWRQVYHTDSVAAAEKPLHPVKLDIGEWASGQIIAIKGPFIVIDTGDELASLCAKDLAGRDVEFEPKSTGLQLNAALQNSLF